MTTGGIIAAASLIVLVGLILWNIRGHPRGGDGSDNQYGPGADGGGGD